ncbi:hypothetical protein B5F77_10420 [Parabacteroides sp. An277]|uniref:DUF6383 domain-containing protein n=1 Tax=Parabacteroides sp. An277 TaxID=1965619 RepID=UPI000B39DB1C|nr:DUF6383 domain-containing protein [Parabacteroides sp. An277]OUO51437.1 hypothetical protein B5F77_10420 [Parabacteroides sp. An277]
MNKKVLTLCAGVLLVGGSAVFTVNAVNAGNGKAQTAYVVKANAEGVAGYELSVVEKASYTWSLVKGDVYYLSPVDGYFLAKDGSIKSIKTSTPDKVTILTDLSISFDGTNSWEQNGEKLYLWKEDGTMQSYEGLNGTVSKLAFATSKEVVELTSGSTNTVYINTEETSHVIAVGTYGDKVDANTWTLHEGGKLSVKGTSDAYLQSDLSLLYSGESTAATFKYEDGILQMAIVGGYTPVYVISTGLTTDADAEGAVPAVLYAIDEEGKVDPEAATDATEGSFILGQGIAKDVIGDTAYGTETISTVGEGGAPGAEYGDIYGIQYQNDGTLVITDVVETAIVPVYIYYKDGDHTYYYTTDGWKENTPVAWYLNNKTLITLDGEWGKSGITYTPDGVTGVGEEGSGATIALAEKSIPADEINNCEIPLLNAVNGDYIILAGRDEAGATIYINGDADGKAVAGTSWQTADLWKVTETVALGDGRYAYKFVNRETGKQLEINGYERFMAYQYNGGIQLLGVDERRAEESVVITTTSGTTSITTTVGRATVLGFYQSKLEQFTAHWLLHRYGSSFRLNVVDKYKDIANKTINGNEFDNTDLVPVYWDATNGFHEIAPENDEWNKENEKAFLLKKKGTNLYIVLNVTDKWSNAVNDFVQGGYKFEVLREANVEDVLEGRQVNNKTYYPYFRINYLEGKTEYDATSAINADMVLDNTPVYCVEIGSASKVFAYDLVNLETTDANGHLDVFVTANDRCADNSARRPNVSFYTTNENIVRGEDATNNPLNYRYVNITFKAGANMQFQNERNNWVNLNGKVLGINQNGVVMPTEADYFLADKAEGQWAVSVDTDDTRKFTFTNRENPSKSISVKSMHALGNDVYAVEYEQNDEWGAQYNWYTRPFGFNTAGTVRNQALRDTLIIKAAEGNLKITKGENAYNTDSYANWTKEDLQDKTFQLSIDAAAQLYVTENEGKDSHFLGLSDDVLDVTNWRLVPFTAARVHDTDAVKYLTAGTDSVYTISHPMYWTGSEFKTYNDTTTIVAYALQNIQNNEWLRYDPSQNQTIESMICDPNSKNFTTKDLNAAYRFVLKEKAKGAQKIEAGAYNIVGVTPWGLNNDKYVTDSNYDKDGNVVTGKAHYELDYSNKLYGASTYQNLGAIEVENMYTQPTSNDIFTIATTASQEYVKATPRDTVRIYGAEENDFLLFEKGQFLNLGNANGIAPAMVLDSAYVERPGNNRYQYLLVVNPTYVEAKFDNHPNSPSVPHMIKPDTMYGRFLVNQIDSAVFVSRNHNNKFINDIEADEKKVKLGFQWGFHTGDKLFLTDGENGPVIETLNLGTADFNKAKFAFKYVNQAVDETFKVQTAWYDYDSAVKAGLDNKDAWTWNNEGFLESVNGVIVVTNGYTHGEEFLMAQEDSNPTANESITAEGAVSVVATDGAVVIKGAEGKNVVIATILGKVVANETINSDNETIAVPAGIAVVSVDGESFKVVVK